MSIIERGRLIRKCADPKRLAYFPENGDLVADLFKRFRIEWVCGNDGRPLDATGLKEWVVVGEKGQIWEYGRGVLGVTVEGKRWTQSFVSLTKSFCTVTQNGDGEVNLRCDWTADNVTKLQRLLKLRKSTRILSDAQKVALAANLKILKALPKAVKGLKKPLEGGI